jgi:hypothetical protein
MRRLGDLAQQQAVKSRSSGEHHQASRSRHHKRLGFVVAHVEGAEKPAQRITNRVRSSLKMVTCWVAGTQTGCSTVASLRLLSA